MIQTPLWSPPKKPEFKQTEVEQYLSDKKYLNTNFDVNHMVRDFYPRSWFWLNKEFLKVYGMGMHQTIIHLRINWGIALLNHGYVGFIYDLARECGMRTDVFNRHFKRIVGVTPTQYRNKKLT